MAGVGLQRSQPQRPVGRAVPAVGGDQGLRLDRVTEFRPGAVRLHGVHIGRGKPGGGQRLLDDALLRQAVRGGQSVRGAVGVHGCSADKGEYRVPVPPCVGQALQQHERHALAPHGAVGGRRERLAPAVRGEAVLLRERHEQTGAGHHHRPARECERGLPLGQRTACQVHRDQ